MYVPYKYVGMGLSSTRGILKLDSRSTKEEEEDRGEGPLPLGLPYTNHQALKSIYTSINTLARCNVVRQNRLLSLSPAYGKVALIMQQLRQLAYFQYSPYAQ